MAINQFFVRSDKGTAVVYLLITLSVISITVSHAFLTTNNRITSSSTWRRTSTFSSSPPPPSLLFARAPPTAKFDLASIEALEKDLDRKAQEKKKEEEDIKQSKYDVESSDEDDDNEHDDDDDSMVETYEVPSSLHNKRIDVILSSLLPELSRSQCGSLVSDGNVAISYPNTESENKFETITRKSEKLEKGSVLKLKHQEDEVPSDIIAQDIPLNILFEDEHMIIINKAAGMVVHPAAGNWDKTVVNALAYYLAYKSPCGSGDFIGNDGKVKSEAADGVDVEGTDGEAVFFRPGIVHRLDKGTTGILVVAKTRTALTALSKAFADRTVKKTYVAITVGNPGERVVIDKPIGRHPLHRQRMRVVPDASKSRKLIDAIKKPSGSVGGRNALSFVDTLAFDGKLSVANVRIETGRTHQIRVHLQDRTTPIYGDEVYGFKDFNSRLLKSHGIARPLLHAFRLELNHPITNEPMVIQAPMADDMQKITTTIWPEAENERAEFFHAS